jgi:hypothetical protein
MTTYCILDGSGNVITTFANPQLPPTQAGYTEIPVTGGQVGQMWNGSGFIFPPPSPAQIEAAIQTALDDYAKSWGYDDCKTACTYVGSTVAKFANEGIALRNWRDATWAYVDTIAAQIQAGTVQTPATIDAALGMLPARPARPT